MTKFLTEIQADINKVKGYIEKKQETVDTHKLAMENAEKDLANLKSQLKELQEEQAYRVEFAKWKKDKKEDKSATSTINKEAIKLESADMFSTLGEKTEDSTTKRRGTKE